MDNSKTRPVFLNLLQIRMPVMAVISFMHRISGILLLLFIPFSIYLLDLSLSNAIEFDKLKLIFESTLGQIFSFVFLWLLLQHLLSGVRFLLIDIDIGVVKQTAKISAWGVAVSALLLTLVITGLLL